jgi:hypothetical protein
MRPVFGHFFLLVFSLFACLPLSALAEDMVEIDVVRGDYLVRICERHLQEPENWRQVADLNRLGNPDLIYPGDRLRIPVIWLRGLPLDGKVTHAQGQVLLEPESGGLIRPLSAGDSIAEGYRITTGERSEATIEFESGVIIRLRSNTTLRVDQANRKDAQTLLFQMFLEVGKVVSRIRQALERDSRFQLETPSAVAGVRGTRFRCGVNAEKIGRYEVLDGLVSVQAEEREVLLPPGTGTVVEPGGAPMEPTALLPPPGVVALPSPQTSLPVEFKLEPVPGAVAYRAVVCLDSGLQEVFTELLFPSDEDLRLDGLPDGKYFLSVSGIDNKSLEGLPSEVVPFEIRVHPLAPQRLMTSGATTLVSGDALFQWKPVNDAVGYRLRIEDVHGVVVNTHGDSSSATATLHPDTPMEYRADVRSIAADGHEGVWSEQVTFLVVPPPAPPEVELPGRAAAKVRLKTVDSGHGLHYRFQVSRTPEFESLVYDAVSDTPETLIKESLETGEYYARVTLVSGEFQSAFSEPTGFVFGERWTLFSTILATMIGLAIAIP